MTGTQIGDAIEQRVDALITDHDHVHADGVCSCNRITDSLVKHDIVSRAIDCMDGPLGPTRGMAIVLHTAFEAGYEFAVRELGGRRVG